MRLIKLLLITALFFFVDCTANAQVSPDSINTLKQQKQNLGLSSKINDNKIKLAKLENTLDKKTIEMQTTSVDAQKAADDNQSAAAELANDPQDKSLARKASKAASFAKKNARKARNAADDLSSLQKQIQNLKDKIAADEAKFPQIP